MLLMVVVYSQIIIADQLQKNTAEMRLVEKILMKQCC